MKQIFIADTRFADRISNPPVPCSSQGGRFENQQLTIDGVPVLLAQKCSKLLQAHLNYNSGESSKAHCASNGAVGLFYLGEKL